jgi:predicted HTH domain antitoxin
MKIKVEVPDDIAEHPNGAREVVEAIALQGYEQGKLSSDAAGRMLGMGRLAFLNFVCSRGVPIYTQERWDEDLKTIEKMKERRLAAQ